MSRKPRWVLSFIRMFRSEKEEEVVTHRELTDEDFPIRRIHRLSEETPMRGRSDRAAIEELVGLARLHALSSQSVTHCQTQSSTQLSPVQAGQSSASVQALNAATAQNSHCSTKTSESHTAVSTGTQHAELPEDLIKSRVANLVQRAETPVPRPDMPIGRRSENKLMAQARKTVNEMPAVPNTETKGHWFNNGQSRYPGGQATRKNSDTMHRLDSFLATRTDEIQALDPNRIDKGDRNS